MLGRALIKHKINTSGIICIFNNIRATRVASIQRNGEYVTQLDFKSEIIDSTSSDHFPVFISIQRDTALNTKECRSIKYITFDDSSIRK